MTFLLGSSQLTYDHFGDWNTTVSICISVPSGVVGDPSQPSVALPGTFMLCEDLETIYSVIEVL